MRKEIRTNFLSTKIAQIVRKSLVSDELSMMGADSFLRKKIINFSLRTKTSISNVPSLVHPNALSFYVTKTVLVGPKWFWSDQIDLDMTIMIWSQP